MTLICGVFRVPRSTVYAQTGPDGFGGVSGGARTAVSYERLLEEIRRVIRESPFHGE